MGLQGYDLVTALGSTLEFTGQTAALVNTDTIEIVRQNLGLDLENGVAQVSLDLAEPLLSGNPPPGGMITKTRLRKFRRRVFGIAHFFRPRIQAASTSAAREAAITPSSRIPCSHMRSAGGSS